MRYLVIGGTGTLGQAIIEKIYHPKKDNITVFSRDELKQKNLKIKYPNIKTILGDVRDKDAVSKAMVGIDAVFLFAAIKHIDFAEENPLEAIKTNILGVVNVADACCDNNVGYCVFSSTDKAVLPINVYGMTKAIAERYLFHKNRRQDITFFSVFRWGNILGSRGSVLNYFSDALKNKRPIDITDKRMTRFWLRIEKAAQFVLDNYKNAPEDEAMIPPMGAARVEEVLAATADVLKIPEYKTKYVGIREGEKIHECVHSNHDVCIRSDNSGEFSREELIDMITDLV